MEEISLTDGKGNFFFADIVDANPNRCSVQIKKTIEEYGKRDFYIHLAIAPTKNINRIEWLLEKATEIGNKCELYSVEDKKNTHSWYTAGMFLETREQNKGLDKLLSYIESI